MPKKNVADETLQIVLNRLKTAKTRCVDLETSGLDWKRHAPVGYVVTFSGDPRDSYYVPFRHAGKGNVGGRQGLQTAEGWDRKLLPGEKELVTALDEPGTLMFGHNVGFDSKFLTQVGFQLTPRIEDTQINEVLINEWGGKFSLAASAERRGVQAKKGEALYAYLAQKFPEARADPKSSMGHYWRLSGDDPMAVEYAVGDGTTTWQLRDRQMQEIQTQDLTKVWDVESRLIPVLVRMTVKGIRVDLEYLGRTVEEINREVDDLLNQFPSGFVARSPGDVQAWMEKNGETNWPLTTKKRQPSFPESFLELSEAGRKVIRIRKMTNLRDSFARPLLETHVWKGRIHPNYNQLRNDEYGTITGRLSSDSPNIQQVPKHNEELARRIRRGFVPDPGCVWADVDYSQCEPRLLAYYSRCKALIEGYRADPPIDAHTSAAIACNKDWFNLSKSEQKEYRNAYAKRINQTIITGGGKGVLVSKYKVDPQEVERVWNDYFRAMPEIKTIQKKASNRMLQRGYILTLLGRRCRLLDKDKSYIALNRMLQGGNADILKLKMVEVDDYLASEGRPIDVLLNCHDATAYQFAEEHRPVYEKCLSIMQSFGEHDLINLDIPMPVDAGEGRDWATASFGPMSEIGNPDEKLMKKDFKSYSDVAIKGDYQTPATIAKFGKKPKRAGG